MTAEGRQLARQLLTAFANVNSDDDAELSMRLMMEFNEASDDVRANALFELLLIGRTAVDFFSAALDIPDDRWEERLSMLYRYLDGDSS